MKNPLTWFKSRTTKQKLIIIVLIIILAFLGYKQTQGSSEKTTYQYATIEKGDITKIVSETGEITATNKTDISTSITGVVTQVYVENGQSVTRDQDLFYIQSTATQTERSQAWANYLSAKTSLEQAQASKYSSQAKLFTAWDNFKELAESDEYELEDGTARTDERNLPEFQTPEKEWLAAEAEYKSQDEVIAKAQASLNTAWLNYQATIDGPVKATATGTVHNLAVATGQAVAANDTALVIKSESQTWVKVAINENDINAVQPGQSAKISIDALSSEPVSGTVQRVDEFGTELSDVMTYYVYITLDETPGQVRPGMTSQVDIITEQKNDILLVPNTAIKLYQGNKAVQIMDPDTNTVINQPITVGIAGDTNSEVLSGLKEGQQIITSSSSTEKSSSGGGMFPSH